MGEMKFVVNVVAICLVAATVWAEDQECPSDIKAKVNDAKEECNGQTGAPAPMRQYFRGGGGYGRRGSGRHGGGRMKCVFGRLENEPFMQEIEASCKQQQGSGELCSDVFDDEEGGHHRFDGGQRGGQWQSGQSPPFVIEGAFDPPSNPQSSIGNPFDDDDDD